MPEFTDQQYDEMVTALSELPPSPAWVVCRSQEEAEAFAAWCVENEIEEPQIAIPE